MDTPLRKLGFYLTVCLVFLRVSMLHQLLAYTLGTNLGLLYLVAVPTFFAFVFAGGALHVLRARTTYFWLAFVLCMIVAIPFSVWPMGSFWVLVKYVRVEFSMLLVIGGLVLSWKECITIMNAVAAGGVVNLLTAKLFGDTESYANRLGMEFGNIANPNDFAGHLVLVLPFVLRFAIGSRSTVVRVVAGGCFMYGISQVLETASRGAALGLIAAGVFCIWRATWRLKVAMIVAAPVCAVILAMLVPQTAWQRLATLSADTGVEESGDQNDTPDRISAIAAASSEARRYLLRTSIEYTLTHPFVGVGPGQFSFYEGTNNIVVGSHGYWHDTHNSYTQVSSECGIPAAMAYIGGLVSAMLLLGAAYRETGGYPALRDARIGIFCVQLGLVGYCVAAAFLNFAYFFYLPAMSGLAIAFWRAVRSECFGHRAPTDCVAAGLSRNTMDWRRA